MKIAICDDDKLCRESLLAALENYKTQHMRPMAVKEFESGRALLDYVERGEEFHVYILDVLMPGMNGIELGKMLREKDGECRILYLSSSREYAVDAFKVRAADYLIKPVDEAELFAVMDEAVHLLNRRFEKSLLVRTRDSSIMISYDNLQYAELEGKNIIYHLTNGEVIEGTAIRTGFSEAVKGILEDEHFVLCGPSRLVNLRHISGIEPDAMVFRNGVRLYISKRASRELRSAWTDFWFSMGG